MDTEQLRKEQGLVVLVCDDEPHILRLVEVNLERMGFTVETAVNGRDALEKLKTLRPSLVLLDVMMPYIDGFEVLRVIRKNPDTAKIPVVMLSVRAQEGDARRAIEAGADGYLTKPFNPEELRRFL